MFNMVKLRNRIESTKQIKTEQALAKNKKRIASRKYRKK